MFTGDLAVEAVTDMHVNKSPEGAARAYNDAKEVDDAGAIGGEMKSRALFLNLTVLLSRALSEIERLAGNSDAGLEWLQKTALEMREDARKASPPDE